MACSTFSLSSYVKKPDVDILAERQQGELQLNGHDSKSDQQDLLRRSKAKNMLGKSGFLAVPGFAVSLWDCSSHKFHTY